MKDSRPLRKILLSIILAVLSVLWLVPVLGTVLASLKSPAEFASQKFYQLPSHVSFMENVKKVMGKGTLGAGFLNSLIYAAAGGAVAIVAASMAGYAIARLRPKLGFLLFIIIASGAFFPLQMYLIPVNRLYSVLGLHDTRAGMILIYSAICIPVSLFVYRAFSTTIPREIEDAARLDGCGPARTFTAIFLPQCLAPTAVVVLFQTTWIWNDLLLGMVLSRTERARPLMAALAAIAGSDEANVPWIMTGVIAASVPTVLVFILLRRFFMQGIALSSALLRDVRTRP